MTKLNITIQDMVDTLNNRYSDDVCILADIIEDWAYYSYECAVPSTAIAFCFGKCFTEEWGKSFDVNECVNLNNLTDNDATKVRCYIDGIEYDESDETVYVYAVKNAKTQEELEAEEEYHKSLMRDFWDFED